MQTNAPASNDFVDQFNRAVAFNQIAIGQALFPDYRMLRPTPATSVAQRNVAAGGNALLLLITGTDNVAVGNTALVKNSTGNNNVAVGSAALGENTTGTGNVAVGENALNYTDGEITIQQLGLAHYIVT